MSRKPGSFLQQHCGMAYVYEANLPYCRGVSWRGAVHMRHVVGPYGFDDGVNQTQCTNATALQAVHQQVDGLLRILHSVNPAHDICDLALSKGDFIMPTLNGWLLGYPVIYLVDEVNVQATADHLSAEGVQRHIVMASSPVLKV